MNDRQQPALWRVIYAGHQLEERVERALGAINLSLPKLGVLRILSDATGPMPLSELAKHSHCVRSNMTQLVDRLEADGLVKRISDAEDRRVRRAALTPTGQRACDQGKRIVEDLERDVAKALPEPEATGLGRALDRLSP